MNKIQITECPRDAMQGITSHFIPTENKIEYINSLLKVGFDVLDVGSFVSHRVIPQMKDTGQVLEKIDISKSTTKLLTIVANLRGAKEAVSYPQVSYLGYPFSISENFQMRNTGATIKESIKTLSLIKELAVKHKKELVVYLSMGFGNPYGEPWDTDVVGKWTDVLFDLGIRRISLSDTIGKATPDTITYLFSTLIPAYPQVDFSIHLHSTVADSFKKIDAAVKAGCQNFDSAIKGYGGCPMASDELIGNLPTEKLLSYLSAKKIAHGVNLLRFETAYNNALKIFD